MAAVLLVREPALAGTGVELRLRVGPGGAARPAPPPAALPGGGLDERDADPDLPWRGAPPSGWGRHLGLPDADAVALLAAAVRETYVADGVLLAEIDDAVDRSALPDAEAGLVVVPAAEADEDAERRALRSGDLALAEVLHTRGLALRSDLLRPWTRWLSPEGAADRTDTWFFLAALPAGARARPLRQAVEAVEVDDDARWWRPVEVLDAEAVGRLALTPELRVAVEELAAAPDLATLLATRRSLTPVRPAVRREGDALWLVADLPQHPDPLGPA